MSPREVRPLLLSAYDAKRCARRIHNEWDPAIENVEWTVPADLQMRFDIGREFEETVFAEIRAALRPEQYADLTGLRGKSVRIAATLEAMDSEVVVILDAWLPDDIAGGRTGRPDLLVRCDDGWVAGDVKAHKIIRARTKGTLTYSRLNTPDQKEATAGFGPITAPRFDDYLQLAHYWRMLEAIGRAPSGPATGFVIGTDDLPDLPSEGRVLTWLDLQAEIFETYSRSRGSVRRSALDRYNHEQGFRLEVARVAAAGQPALVRPIFTDECTSCPWFDLCLGVTGSDVASAQIKSGRLSVREWNALAALGVVSLGELAELDVEDPRMASSYLPEVTHIKDPLDRLAHAVRRAQMTQRGVLLERETSGRIDFPRADVEIDFDIEWDSGERIYLWGALLNRAGSPPAYHPIVEWRPLDDDAETALAQRFCDWLRAEIVATEEAGQTLRIYHYSNPEPMHLKRLLGAENVADLTKRFVDLLPIVRRHYFGLYGLGIKKVAPAFGFQWRDDDPGGLQSQLWLLEARATDDDTARLAGQQRILDYNEDDVRATAAIRNGL